MFTPNAFKHRFGGPDDRHAIKAVRDMLVLRLPLPGPATIYTGVNSNGTLGAISKRKETLSAPGSRQDLSPSATGSIITRGG